MKHIDTILNTIDYERDYKYDFFGFKTLERAYLLKSEDDIGMSPRYVDACQFVFTSLQYRESFVSVTRKCQTMNSLMQHLHCSMRVQNY